MNDKPNSSAVYWIVFGLLLLLLAATVIAAQFDLGRGNILLGLGIAAAKAALIALFFMHLRQATALVRLTAVAGLLWLGFLLSLTLADYTTRGWDTPGSGRLADEQRPLTVDRTEVRKP